MSPSAATAATVSGAASDPLQAAVAADRALWDLSDPHPSQRIALRDAAVRDPSAAGYSRDEIAAALHMRTADVDRILNP
jgi:hypothetical protein